MHISMTNIIAMSTGGVRIQEGDVRMTAKDEILERIDLKSRYQIPIFEKLFYFYILEKGNVAFVGSVKKLNDSNYKAINVTGIDLTTKGAQNSSTLPRGQIRMMIMLLPFYKSEALQKLKVQILYTISS